MLIPSRGKLALFFQITLFLKKRALSVVEGSYNNKATKAQSPQKNNQSKIANSKS